MLCSKQELFEVIERIANVPVLVVGDIILDRYVWGSVSRISPEAPVPVVDVKRSEDRLGGSANVVRNLCEMGCKVSLCGFVGDDEEGRTALAQLHTLGVDSSGVMVDPSKPTTLKTRIMAQKQQMLRIDRESDLSPPLALKEGFAAIVDSHLDAAKTIILSDYGKGAISESLMRTFSQARAANRIGLAQRPLVLDPHPANYALYRGITVAKPNRREAELATGVRLTDKDKVVEAARQLLQKWQAEMILITLGEDGLAIVSADSPNPIFLATVAQQVFDVSGAGDTVTALFSVAIAAGASPAIAGDLANIAAGVVVSEVGTAPITIPKLKHEIERLANRQRA